MISLKIKGNKRGNEGIGSDLLAIGDDRFPVVDAQYAGAGATTDFIIVRHLADKSIYTIITKNVTPSDSSRDGTLLVSVAVPTGEHVEGLFKMLLELSGYYKSSFMTYDGERYHFTQTPETPEGFQEIINRHQITKYPFKPVLNSPDLQSVAYIFMTPEQIGDVLDDPMRPEFAKYGQIVLVPTANPAAMTSTITIPAKIWRNYRINVNGRPSQQNVADPTKIISITLPESATHKSATVQFSITEARSGAVKGVTVDDRQQIISVSLQPVKKEPIIAPVTTITPKTDVIQDRHSNKRTAIIIISAVVLGLITMGAVAYYFGLFSKKEKAEQKEDIETPEITAPRWYEKTQAEQDEDMNRFGEEERTIFDEALNHIEGIIPFNWDRLSDKEENDAKKGRAKTNEKYREVLLNDSNVMKMVTENPELRDIIENPNFRDYVITKRYIIKGNQTQQPEPTEETLPNQQMESEKISDKKPNEKSGGNSQKSEKKSDKSAIKQDKKQSENKPPVTPPLSKADKDAKAVIDKLKGIGLSFAEIKDIEDAYCNNTEINTKLRDEIRKLVNIHNRAIKALTQTKNANDYKSRISMLIKESEQQIPALSDYLKKRTDNMTDAQIKENFNRDKNLKGYK